MLTIIASFAVAHFAPLPLILRLLLFMILLLTVAHKAVETLALLLRNAVLQVLYILVHTLNILLSIALWLDRNIMSGDDLANVLAGVLFTTVLAALARSVLKQTLGAWEARPMFFPRQREAI